MPTYPPNVTFTPRLQLPRPGLDDPADAPDAFNDLTDILDPETVVYATGTLAARPAAGVPGRFYWASDTRTLYYDDGASWSTASGAAPIGTSLPILDVGMAGQIRAGRQLTVADFTSLGLAQPIGLWNLSGLTNLGSDGQALANKGAVPFGVGINGLASTSAVFAGSASQALYIPGASAANYNIRTGSFGCWFRTAKRGASQDVLSKWSATAGQQAWLMNVGTANVVFAYVSTTGSDLAPVTGVSDVADDRWHFVVATHDGTALRLYVDGALEAVTGVAAPVFGGSAPLNVSGRAADAGASAGTPFYGRVDEAFVTADILSEDQVRCLYAARLTHALGLVPTGVRLNITRRRRGAPLVVGDFTTSPLRLYNFTAGDLVGVGSDTTGNRTLSNAFPLLILSVSGVDGTPGGAFSFGGAHQGLGATDAGLPNLLTTRSYGCWFKTATAAGGQNVLTWGTIGTADARLALNLGTLYAASGADQLTGPYAADGQWHLAVVVEDNTAGDGVRRKLYLDGRLVGGSTVLNTLTLAGATKFRIGSDQGGANVFTGQIDGAFVCGYALGADDVARLWAKGSQALAASPKNPGDHVEALDSGGILFIADALNSQDTVDLGVVA